MSVPAMWLSRRPGISHAPSAIECRPIQISRRYVANSGKLAKEWYSIRECLNCYRTMFINRERYVVALPCLWVFMLRRASNAATTAFSA